MRNSTHGSSSAVFALVLVSAVLSNACSGINKSLEGPRPAAPPSAGTVGIRHMGQLAPSMAVVTGVSISSTSTAKRYDGQALTDGPLGMGGAAVNFSDFSTQIQPWLSADGNASGVTATMLLASTGLSGLFCSTFLYNESSGPAKVLTEVKFNQGVAGLTPAVTTSVIGKFAKMFWRRPPTDSEVSTLSTALTEAIAALPGTLPGGSSDPSAKAQAALLVPCTAALSSVAFLSI